MKALNENRQRIIGKIYSSAVNIIEMSIKSDNLPLDIVQYSVNKLFEQRKQIANAYLYCEDETEKEHLIDLFSLTNNNIKEILGL